MFTFNGIIWVSFLLSPYIRFQEADGIVLVIGH